jgi:hypothetical protein
MIQMAITTAPAAIINRAVKEERLMYAVTLHSVI